MWNTWVWYGVLEEGNGWGLRVGEGVCVTGASVCLCACVCVVAVVWMRESVFVFVLPLGVL